MHRKNGQFASLKENSASLSQIFIGNHLEQALHMNRNDYYVGESTSLNLTQLWKHFKGSEQPPKSLGSSRDNNVDMIPKFMMANEGLVRALIHTNVTKYLNFKAVDGSFVYKKGKIYKVPATDVKEVQVFSGHNFDGNACTKESENMDLKMIPLTPLVMPWHYILMITIWTSLKLLILATCYFYLLVYCYRYLFYCSYTHNVASKGKYIAFVTTEAETDNPEVELRPGIDLLGPIDEIFFETYDRFVPTNNHDVDNCFISMLESLKSK
ncbi:Guanosine nucleotide diphosphate dissociation inhibitor [Camellia lanceoleosa]|uniref:Guanosine nucleotide diphosphate dissociation inhibitor n=1 Tax=Camellia lanceoleosa TaxID=1840588 RepID=A0ACC0GXY5_9ERIC|nr:Guanosine nucleotide diphosphate dissociation inhibitor [Camellia lanceoleosa]